jgi:anti-sigma regulatory factor (Ser/Thr protein kinase)
MAVLYEWAFARISWLLCSLDSHMDQIQSKVLPARNSTSPWVEVRQSLPRRVAAISPFVDQLMSFIRRFFRNGNSTNSAEGDIENALCEALSNTILYGNLERAEQRVSVSCRCTMDGEVRIRVRDEDPGFEAFRALNSSHGGDLMLDHGRELYLLKSLMDEVALEEHGRVVMMRKRLRVA